MKLRTIGKSNIQVPQLTLGTMSFNRDKKSVINMLSQALDQGIIHIDTADLYDFGHNETLIGDFVKYHRDQIVLTTKVGNHFNPQTKKWFWDPSRKYITTAVKDSLQRLQTDYIDLYDFGHNETLIGDFVKYHRDQIVLTTKVGNHFNPQTKKWFWDPSRKYITTAVKDSLQRLQTDYIDLYLLHGGTIEDPVDETI